MGRIIASIAVAALVSACAEPTPPPMASGVPLTDEELTMAFVGKTLSSPQGWTWTFSADGTHSSAANDGSWSDEGGTYEIVGQQICRTSPMIEGTRCSQVYLMDGVYRFTIGAGTTEIETWAVTPAG